MTELTGKQISQSYKQLLKVAVSTNTGVTNDLVQVETGDGTNTAMQISTSIINITGSFGVTENASISGDLQIKGAVCASSAFFGTFNVSNLTVTGAFVADKVCASAFFGDGSNLTNVPTSGDVSVSSLRVTHNASIGGTLSVVGAVGLNSTLTVADYSHFKDDVSVSGNVHIGGTTTIAGAASIGGAL